MIDLFTLPTQRLASARTGVLIGMVFVLLGNPIALADDAKADPAETFPIQMESVLRLAGAENLQIKIARERMVEARAEVDASRLRMYPWIAPGLTYRRHDGQLQDIAGEIFPASKQLGVAAVELNAQLDLGENWFNLLAARQLAVGASEEAEGRRQQILFDAAVAYLDLVLASASVGVMMEALRITSNYHGQVEDAVAAGLAFRGDALRVEVQMEQNRAQLHTAQEAYRLASLHLSRMLRLPMTVTLLPDESEMVPFVLVDADRGLDSLITESLGRRPELQAAEARRLAASRLQDSVVRGPWVPSLGAQVAAGALGGGRNREFDHWNNFQDYRLGFSWRIGSGGLGDRGRMQAARSRAQIADLELESVRDILISEVIAIHTRYETVSRQLSIARRTVETSQSLLDLTLERRRIGVGQVLEAIDAEREWTRSRLEFLEAITRHNHMQWSLWRALGRSEPSLGEQ